MIISILEGTAFAFVARVTGFGYAARSPPGHFLNRSLIMTSLPSLCLSCLICARGTMMTLLDVVMMYEGVLPRMHLPVHQRYPMPASSRLFSHPPRACRRALPCLPLLIDLAFREPPYTLVVYLAMTQPRPCPSGYNLRATPSVPLPANALSPQTFLPLSSGGKMRQTLTLERAQQKVEVESSI